MGPADWRNLILDPLSGPTREVVVVRTGQTATLGRHPECTVRLTSDDSISRRHAQLLWRGGRWFIADLGSRHGTLLNAQPLRAEEPVPLSDGDFVQLGSSTFRVRQSGSMGGIDATTVAGEVGPAVVKPVDQAELTSHDRVRLDLFIECAAAIGQGEDAATWADSMLDAAVRGTGYPRAALVRWAPGSELVEVQHFRAKNPAARPRDMACSISLIHAASRGFTARLEDAAVSAGGESIQRLRITSALCSPVRVGGAITEFLYMDAREGEPAPLAGAGAFCDGLAKLWGIGQAVLKQRERERQEAEIRRDLEAAREVQEMIMPDESGVVGGVRFARVMKPGRIVAGDMFDIFELPDGRVAMLLGDVESKGVGAAMVMAIAQTHLRSTLMRTGDPSSAVRALSERLPERGVGGRTITAWVGVYDRAAQRVSFCVAGHGYWMHARTGKPFESVQYSGGPPIGTAADHPYETELLAAAEGDRLLVYSDGVAEQPGRAGGEMYGRKRVSDALAEVQGEPPFIIVQHLVGSVTRYAGSATLADDTTVACMTLG